MYVSSLLPPPLPGFKLKDFLKDNETMSTFLMQKVKLPENATQEILEAPVNLERVNSHIYIV